jgi:hypothetical protein
MVYLTIKLFLFPPKYDEKQFRFQTACYINYIWPQLIIFERDRIFCNSLLKKQATSNTNRL